MVQRKCGDGGIQKEIVTVDRIEQAVGYIRSNIRLICFAANNARYVWNDAELIEFCEVVLSHRERTMDNARFLANLKHSTIKTFNDYLVGKIHNDPHICGLFPMHQSEDNGILVQTATGRIYGILNQGMSESQSEQSSCDIVCYHKDATWNEALAEFTKGSNNGVIANMVPISHALECVVCKDCQRTL